MVEIQAKDINTRLMGEKLQMPTNVENAQFGRNEGKTC